MTKHYPVDQRVRAVKMVLDHLDEHRSVCAAFQVIGPGRRQPAPWCHDRRAAADQGPRAASARSPSPKPLCSNGSQHQ